MLSVIRIQGFVTGFTVYPSGDIIIVVVPVSPYDSYSSDQENE